MAGELIRLDDKHISVKQMKMIIEGYLMPDLSRNLIHLRWLLKLVDF
ncbi:hypothetical protein Gotur_004053 [Gossypium turneri]